MDTANLHNKFFLYARKSTDVEDKQVQSIEAQLVELRELVKRDNLEIVEEFIEKQSAKIPGRPIFNRMLDLIEKGRANGIICWHPDRLARNSVDGGKIIYLIDTGKISALKFNTFWFEPTPQGKFMLNIAFCQSKYYIDSLSENTKRGHRQRARNGYMPGKAPVGYLNDSRNKTVVVDKRFAPLVKKGFEKYSTGGVLLKDISSYFVSKGIVTGQSKSAKLGKTKKILTNTYYYGVFTYDGEVFEGRYDPIISKRLFDEVQVVINRKNHQWSNARVKRVPKPFTGLLKCGECGMMVTAETRTKYYVNGNIGTFKYYHCTKKSRFVKCLQPNFTREEVIDKQLSSLIKNYSLKKSWAITMNKKLTEEEKDIAQSCLDIISIKRKDLEQIDVKLKLLLDSYLDQIIEKESFQEKKYQFVSQKKTLEEQILSLKKNQGNWIEPMRNWISEAQTTTQVAKSADLELKKVLAAKIFGSNLFLENKTIRGIGQNAWSALRADPLSRDCVVALGIEPRTLRM